MPHPLPGKIKDVLTRVEQECIALHLNPKSIRVIGVTKGKTPDDIQKAYHQGIVDMGENYWQEAKEKMNVLADLPLVWHFIGPLQSNKAKAIAKHFDWVHSVDRVKLAKILNEARAASPHPLNVCIQVNLDDETSKSGLKEQDLNELVNYIETCPHLILRGIMGIPKPSSDANVQYQSFLRFRRLFDRLKNNISTVDTLSLGMSEDWPQALSAGSTCLRLGRALFGERIRKTS